MKIIRVRAFLHGKDDYHEFYLYDIDIKIALNKLREGSFTTYYCKILKEYTIINLDHVSNFDVTEEKFMEHKKNDYKFASITQK
jgi:hypothetical protein